MLSYETGDAGVTITDCEESAEGEVVIPDEIAGLPVISIGFEAFIGCSNLTSIIIPDGVSPSMHATASPTAPLRFQNGITHTWEILDGPQVYHTCRQLR